MKKEARDRASSKSTRHNAVAKLQMNSTPSVGGGEGVATPICCRNWDKLSASMDLSGPSVGFTAYVQYLVGNLTLSSWIPDFV